MDRVEMLGRFARTAVGAVVFLVVGLGMVAGGGGALVAEVPDGDRELRAYEAASRCAGAPRGAADCIWTQAFTVEETDPSPRGRGNPPYAVLRGAGGDRWRATFGNRGPVLEMLDRGDRVTGTIWRGTLTEVAAGGASQTTAEAPADMRARAGVVAMMLIPSGLVLAAASFWRLLRRRRSRAMTPGQRATFALSLGFLMTAMISPVPAAVLPYDDEAQHAVYTAAIWLPVAALLIIGARVYTVRRRGRDAVPEHDAAVPAPPAAGRR